LAPVDSQVPVAAAAASARAARAPAGASATRSVLAHRVAARPAGPTAACALRVAPASSIHGDGARHRDGLPLEEHCAARSAAAPSARIRSAPADALRGRAGARTASASARGDRPRDRDRTRRGDLHGASASTPVSRARPASARAPWASAVERRSGGVGTGRPCRALVPGDPGGSAAAGAAAARATAGGITAVVRRVRAARAAVQAGASLGARGAALIAARPRRARGVGVHRAPGRPRSSVGTNGSRDVRVAEYGEDDGVAAASGRRADNRQGAARVQRETGEHEDVDVGPARRRLRHVGHHERRRRAGAKGARARAGAGRECVRGRVVGDVAIDGGRRARDAARVRGRGEVARRVAEAGGRARRGDAGARERASEAVRGPGARAARAARDVIASGGRHAGGARAVPVPHAEARPLRRADAAGGVAAALRAGPPAGIRDGGRGDVGQSRVALGIVRQRPAAFGFLAGRSILRLPPGNRGILATRGTRRIPRQTRDVRASGRRDERCRHRGNVKSTHSPQTYHCRRNITR